jgi:hypothetical protein
MADTQTLASFESALAASGRSPEIPEDCDIYGWLVGSWDLDVIHYWKNVADRNLKGELHAAWVLEGRAIQDLWIMPRLLDREAGTDKNADMYGTTLRVWNPSLQAWSVTWINPVTAAEERLVGRSVSGEIVQLGSRLDGTLIRWRFTDITKDSFHWIGEFLQEDGKTWTLAGEFLARRRG